MVVIKSKIKTKEEIHFPLPMGLIIMAISTGRVIQRQLPKSDEGRLRALKMAKLKNDALGVGSFLTTPTKTRLNNITSTFTTTMQNRASALVAQGGSTTLVVRYKDVAKITVGQFIEIFNKGVKRGKYKKEDRAFYSLPINSRRKPKLSKESDIILWGGRVIAGEPLRVAAGGTAMTDPDIGEVTTAMTNFTNENTSQSGLKDAYDVAQEAVVALRTEADAVIKKVWDEVETFKNEETKSSARRDMREWGVVFVSNITKTFNFHVTDQAHAGVVIADALIELVETGNKKHTGADGNAVIKSRIDADEAHFHIEAAGFQPLDVTVTLTDGVLVFSQNVEMVPV